MTKYKYSSETNRATVVMEEPDSNNFPQGNIDFGYCEAFKEYNNRPSYPCADGKWEEREYDESEVMFGLVCTTDEQQCRDSCEHKNDRKNCPLASLKAFLEPQKEMPYQKEFEEYIKKYYPHLITPNTMI